MNISANQLEILIHIAREAGDAVMEIYARPTFESQVKSDDSPLTEADLASDQIIRKGLETNFPNIFILSEESGNVKDIGNVKEFFLVDPLDGTKEFIKRNGEFTINIAWIVDGVAIAGVVYAPALNELFYAAQGLGAWKKTSQGDAQSLRVTAATKNQTLRVVGSRSHGAEEMEKWLAQLEQPYEFTAAGSSLKFCRVAEGAADVYPRFGLTSQWDTAAGQCVVEQAGGMVRDVDGNLMLYGIDREILNPFFIAQAKY